MGTTHKAGGGEGGGRLVTLGPMEIRTWEVVLGWKKVEVEGGKEQGWEGWFEEGGLMEMM